VLQSARKFIFCERLPSILVGIPVGI